MIFVILAAIVGACIGSFLTVVAHRLPQIMMQEWRADVADFIDQSIQNPTLVHHKNTVISSLTTHSKPISLALPRSHCVHCQKTISWYDNIPILSYVLLMGRCRHCQHKISKSYPITELGCAILSALVMVRFDLNEQGLLSLLFVWFLLVLSMIDLRHQLLPDRLVLPFGMIGLVANAFFIFTTPAQAILGAVSGFILLWLLNAIYRLIAHRDGMGLGDAKLLAALGAWLGLTHLPLVLFLAAVFGVLAGIFYRLHGRQEFAFGPYLAMGGLLVLFFGEWLLDYLFGMV